MQKQNLFLFQLILLTIFISQYLQRRTYEDWVQCHSKINLSCNNSCENEIQEECNHNKSVVYRSDQCKYVRNFDVPKGEGLKKKIEEKFGEMFHGCYLNCLDELSNSQAIKLKEAEKACSSEILNFKIVLLFYIFSILCIGILIHV